MKVDGKAVRPKQCVKCGAKLPAALTFPKKAAVAWFVRQFDPRTGKQRDFPAPSSEAADELIRTKEREWTPDPVRTELIGRVVARCHEVEADDIETAVNQVIVALGGDAIRKTLKPVGWDEACDIICDEMRQKGRVEDYIDETRRVVSDFRTVTGLTELADVNLDAIARYRSVRMNGGWQRNGRMVKGVQGRAMNKDLATLSAFFGRAARKGWIARNPQEGARDERVKVRAVRVEYMPDEDLQALIAAADATWMRALIIVAHYTGARRGDLLRLEWERDIDLDGSRAAAERRSGPHIFIRGSKADTPHWMPLHPAAVRALGELRREPVIDRGVFVIRRSRKPDSRVSHLFADLCVRAGLTETVERNGQAVVKNRWSLHDLRRKANTDLRNRGASPKERAALLGHRTTAVNESHYEAVLPSRERKLIDDLPVFGRTA